VPSNQYVGEKETKRKEKNEGKISCLVRKNEKKIVIDNFIYYF